MVTVTDSTGCTGTDTAFISEPPIGLSIGLTATDETCAGCMDGTVAANVMGGTPPYTYSWSNGASTDSLSGLAAGDYVITVTDSNGCTLTDSASVGLMIGRLAELETGLDIYPNPATNVVNIQLHAGQFSDAQFELVNVWGQIVQQWKADAVSSTQGNVTGLAPGLYWLRIQQDGRQALHKV